MDSIKDSLDSDMFDSSLTDQAYRVSFLGFRDLFRGSQTLVGTLRAL